MTTTHDKPTGEPPKQGVLSDTITGRLVVLGLVTALVSVLAVGLVGFQMVRSAAEAQARATLDRQADVLASLAGQLSPDRSDEFVFALDELERQSVAAHLVLATEAAPESVPIELLTTALRTGSASGSSGDPESLLEARRVGQGAVLVLETPVSHAVNDVASPLLKRLGFALIIGLVVAVAAGSAVARRLTRPMRDAGEAAQRLSTGERSVRMEPDGPLEVVELAEAINGLADALERSESRQRRFLLSVSHELKTPLTAVRGYAEALADGVVTGEDAVRAGEVIGAEADRLDELMTDLLALARAEADDFPLDMTQVDLRESVAAAAAAWAEPCRRSGIDLRTESPETPVLARADPFRARQIVDALVANSVRVTPEGKPLVLASVLLPDGAPALQVRDGGPGLADDDLPVAFDQGVLRDRYQGTRQGGSGIGLALVERLTRRMGGTASAGHAPEGGASFTVAFRAAKAPPVG